MKLTTGLLSLVIVLLLLSSVSANDSVNLITYGPNSPTIEGDNDYRQLIEIRIPASIRDTLYLQLFDPDVGGEIDDQFGRSWDTETRFVFFGQTLPNPESQALPLPGENLGQVLASHTFGEDDSRDNVWKTFTSFTPEQGRRDGEMVVFTLAVEGLTGNDGNIYDVTVSRDPDRNNRPPGIEILNHEPTIRLPKNSITAELRFVIPDSARYLIVHNFDLAHADIRLNTAFRSDLRSDASGQDEWRETRFQISPLEQNRLASLTFTGGEEMPNDATFRIVAESGENLAFGIPFQTKTETNHRPEPKIAVTFLPDCFSVTLDASGSTDRDGDVLDFRWDLGDGQTAAGEQITHRFPTYGEYEVSLIATDNSGQVENAAVATKRVRLNEPPVAMAGTNVIAAPGQAVPFDATRSHDPDGQITEYRWNFGDGHTSTQAKTNHRYQEPGRYHVELRVEDGAATPCNFATDSLEVWINAQPILELGENRIASIDETIIFDGESAYDEDGQIIEYIWHVGEDTQLSGQRIEHIFDEPGQYRIKLTVVDDAGVENSRASDEFLMIINDPPEPVAGADQRVAAHETVSFDGSESFDRDGEITAYHWKFGDGQTATGAQVSHAYTDPGRYTVVLTVTDDSQTSTAQRSDSLTVIVNYPPVANAGEQQLVTASEVQFDSSQSYDEDGHIISYQWDFGDGTTGSGVEPTHVYGNPGLYTVGLTIRDDSGTSSDQATDTLTVRINQKPIADAGPSLLGAPGESLTFDGTASIDPDGDVASYTWSFGDGQTADGAQVQHSYTALGRYPVQLTVADNTGHPAAIDYAYTTVTINAAPVVHIQTVPARAGEAVRIAPGQELTLDASAAHDPDGHIVTYRWDIVPTAAPEKIETETATSISRTFTESATYLITLTVTDDSAARNNTASQSLMVTVNHAPIARVGENPVPEEYDRGIVSCGRTVEFDGSQSTDADGDPLSYYWDFGDGSAIKTGQHVRHTYAQSGTYPVILTVDDGTVLGNSRDETVFTVTINQPPVADAGDDELVCAGDMVVFSGARSSDPEGGALRYFWDFGDSTFAEGVSPTKIYKKGGVYPVTLTVEDDSGMDCNRSVDRMVVRVAEAPVANAGPDLIVCANTNVQFDGSDSWDIDGLVNQYHWDFDDGTSSGGVSPVHIFKEPGTYKVKLTIQGDPIGFCDHEDTDEIIVTVEEAPEAKFTSPEVVASGDSVQLDASGSDPKSATIVDWAWDFGDGRQGTGEQAVHMYQTAGRYYVTLTITTDTETTCNTVSTRNVIVVNAPPVAEAGDNQRVGINQEVILDASASYDPDGSIVHFIWDLGDGQTARGVQVRHAYRHGGRFPVTLTVVDNSEVANNTNTDFMVVDANRAPEPVIDAPATGCVGEVIALSAANSDDEDGSLVENPDAVFQWRLGDGQTAMGMDISHTYQQPGTYQVMLTIDDGSGTSNSTAQVTRSIDINVPPMAQAGPDRVACPQTPVSFDASLSSDSDGELVEVAWDFGDGQRAAGQRVEHVFENPGTYEVKLTVRDDSGSACDMHTDMAIVKVNAAPVAIAGDDQVVYFGGAHDGVHLNAGQSHDPDGDPLTYEWDLGDGTRLSGQEISYTYHQPGAYNVVLTVNDGSQTGCSQAQDELTVTVKSRSAADQAEAEE